ncbi:MAG: phosphoribosylglycinamide synthetase C domain-containing protein, partial [Pricia sp.]
AIGNQTLDAVDLEIDNRTAATVMLVSGGYPEAYEKGKEIEGLETVVSTDNSESIGTVSVSRSNSGSGIHSESETAEGSLVFHAGTRLDGNKIVTNGGRVMAITSYGENFKDALETSYKNIQKINFEGMNYRKDIGFDL